MQKSVSPFEIQGSTVWIRLAHGTSSLHLEKIMRNGVIPLTEETMAEIEAEVLSYVSPPITQSDERRVINRGFGRGYRTENGENAFWMLFAEDTTGVVCGYAKDSAKYDCEYRGNLIAYLEKSGHKFSGNLNKGKPIVVVGQVAIDVDKPSVNCEANDGPLISLAKYVYANRKTLSEKIGAFEIAQCIGEVKADFNLLGEIALPSKAKVDVIHTLATSDIREHLWNVPLVKLSP